MIDDQDGLESALGNEFAHSTPNFVLLPKNDEILVSQHVSQHVDEETQRRWSQHVRDMLGNSVLFHL